MKNWEDIHTDFTEELQEEWKEKGFTYEQTKEWIDIGMTVNDVDYVVWLRDVKQKDTDWVLNNGHDKELRAEFSLPQNKSSEDKVTVFCCQHTQKAHELVKDAFSQISNQSPNDTGRKGRVFTNFFNKSRLNNAIDDYKCWMVKASEYLREAENEMRTCNCAEKKENENLSLQEQLKISESNEWKKDEKLEKLNQSFENLQIEKIEKETQLVNTQNQLESKEKQLKNLTTKHEKKLKGKNNEISCLKGFLKNSEEEVLNQKISSKQGELDRLVNKLKVNEELVWKLSDAYEELINSSQKNERKSIRNAESNIRKIKQEIKQKKEVDFDDLNRVYDLCEEVIRLKLQREELREEQQYEVKQEFPFRRFY